MPEKKNKKTRARKPEDLRKKYPVDKILSQAEELSIEKLAKQFKLTVLIIHKIIRRYGSDELKKKVSDRHPKKKKEAKEEEKKKEDLGKMQEYMNNLEAGYTMLQTPTLNLAGLSNKLQMLTERAIGVSVNGDARIDEITESLRAKDVDFEYVEAMRDTLKKFETTNLKAIRLAMQGCREQASVQEKYIRLEVMSRNLEDVKTLIKYIFESFNVLNDEYYGKIKTYLITLAPATEGYFNSYEESYQQYKAEKLGLGNSGNEETASERRATEENTSTRNSN